MDNTLPPGIHNPSNFCYIISTIQCLKNLRSIKKFINQNTNFDKTMTVILNGYGFKVMNKDKFIESIKTLKNNLDTNDEEAINIKSKIMKQLEISETQFSWFLNKIRDNNNNMYMYFAYLNLLKRLLSQTNTVLDMREFITIFRIVTRDNGNQYISMGQNDASEFLTFLIDYFHESHSVSVGFNKEEPQEKMRDCVIEKMPLEQRIRIGFLKHFKNSVKNSFTSLIPDLHHYTLNMIKCKDCGFANLSYAMENILCLSLYQKDKGGSTLSIYDTLDKHFSDEMLEGYSCDKCKNKNGNTISKMILTNPDTFIICLKRTGYNVDTNSMEKINIKVEYPLFLNLDKYYPRYMNSDTNANYKLSGVVNQVGDNNFGHYFSFVYDDNLEKWLLCNDERVQFMEEYKVINSDNAYLLFYQKV